MGHWQAQRRAEKLVVRWRGLGVLWLVRYSADFLEVSAVNDVMTNGANSLKPAIKTLMMRSENKLGKDV